MGKGLLQRVRKRAPFRQRKMVKGALMCKKIIILLTNFFLPLPLVPHF